MRFLQSYPTRVRKILTLIIVTVFLTNTIAPSAIFAQNFKTRPKTQMVRAESRQLSDCQTVRPSDRQTVRPFNSQLLKDQYLQSMEKLKNSSSADAELSAQTEEMLDLVKNRLFLSGPYEKTAVSSESRQGGTLSYRQKYLKESSQPKAHSPEQDFTSSKHKAQSKPLYIFGAYQGDLSRIYFVMKYQGYAVSHEPWALSYRQKYLKESSQSRLGGTQSKPFDTLRLAPGSVEFETRLQLTLELLGGALAGMGQQPIRIYTGSEAYRLLQSHEWQLASNVRNFSGPAKAGQARSKSLTLPFTDHLSLATDHLLEIFIPQSELTPQIQSQSITFNIKQLPPLSPLPPLPHLLSLKILRDHGFIPTFAEEMRRLHYSAEQLLAHLKHHGYRIGYICANQAVNLCRSVFYLERELPGGMMRSNNNNNNNNVNTNNANSAGTIFQQALSALKEGSLHKAIEILSQEVSGASDYPQALREAAQEIRQNEKLQKMLMEIVLSSREDNQSPTSKVQRPKSNVNNNNNNENADIESQMLDVERWTLNVGHKKFMASSLAITLLNAAHVSFSGMDLGRIRIPGADLSFAELEGTDLREADLPGVNFIGANLKGASLDRAWMKDSQLQLESKAVKYQCTLSGHLNIVSGMAFSPNGKLLAIGSLDKTVKLWDVESGKCAATLSGHSSFVTGVAFSPNGKMLASGSYDASVKLWEIPSDVPAKRDPTSNSKGEQGWKCVATLSRHTSAVKGVAFSPNGKLLASGSWDHSVKVWDAESRQCVATLSGHTNAVRGVAFSPNGKLLASGGNDSSVKLWEIPSDLQSPTSNSKGEQGWQCVATLSEHLSYVSGVAFSPNGKLLASGSNDSSVKLWDVESRQCVATLSGHSSFVYGVTYSPNGKLLASGSHDNTVKLWEIPSDVPAKRDPTSNSKGEQGWQCVATLSGHSDSVMGVAYSPNGKLLASGSHDNTVKLWNVFGLSLTIVSQSSIEEVRGLSHQQQSLLKQSGAIGTPTTAWQEALEQRQREQEQKLRQELEQQKQEMEQKLQEQKQKIESLEAWKNQRLEVPKLISEASQKLRARKYEEAVQVYERILQLAPENREAQQGLFESRVKLQLQTLQMSLQERERQIDAFNKELDQLSANHEQAREKTAVTKETESEFREIQTQLEELKKLQVEREKELRQYGIELEAFREYSEQKSAQLQKEEDAVNQQTENLLRQTETRKIELETIRQKVKDEEAQRQNKSKEIEGLAKQSGNWNLQIEAGKKSLADEIEKCVTECETLIKKYGKKGHSKIKAALEEIKKKLEKLQEQVRGVPAPGVIQAPEQSPIPAHHPLRPLPLVPTLAGLREEVQNVNKETSANINVTGPVVSRVEPQSIVKEKKLEPLITLSGHTHHVYGVAFSPNSKLLASASSDSTLRLWDVESRQCAATLSGHTKYLKGVTFSPDGKLLASASADHTVKLWDMGSLQCVATLSGHRKEVEAAAFSPDGKLLASASHDKSVKVWDMKNVATWHSPVFALKHTNAVWAVAFSPDGKLLASASWDKSVKLWDVESRQCVATLSGHTSYVMGVTFSPSGKLLASASIDQSIRLWDVKNSQCTAILSGHTDGVSAVAFSPDGKLLASVGGDRTVKLWRLESPRYLTVLSPGNMHYMYGVAFSPNGELLASGSTDCTVKVWKLSSLPVPMLTPMMPQEYPALASKVWDKLKEIQNTLRTHLEDAPDHNPFTDLSKSITKIIQHMEQWIPGLEKTGEEIKQIIEILISLPKTTDFSAAINPKTWQEETLKQKREESAERKSYEDMEKQWKTLVDASKKLQNELQALHQQIRSQMQKLEQEWNAAFKTNTEEVPKWIQPIEQKHKQLQETAQTLETQTQKLQKQMQEQEKRLEQKRKTIAELEQENQPLAVQIQNEESYLKAVQTARKNTDELYETEKKKLIEIGKTSKEAHQKIEEIKIKVRRHKKNPVMAPILEYGKLLGKIQKLLEDDLKYVCPITDTLMEKPMVGSDGHRYEIEALKKWLEQNPTSPQTRQPMPLQNEKFEIDPPTKRDIDDYRENIIKKCLKTAKQLLEDEEETGGFIADLLNRAESLNWEKSGTIAEKIAKLRKQNDTDENNNNDSNNNPNLNPNNNSNDNSNVNPNSKPFGIMSFWPEEWVRTMPERLAEAETLGLILTAVKVSCRVAGFQSLGVKELKKETEAVVKESKTLSSAAKEISLKVAELQKRFSAKINRAFADLHETVIAFAVSDHRSLITDHQKVRRRTATPEDRQILTGLAQDMLTAFYNTLSAGEEMVEALQSAVEIHLLHNSREWNKYSPEMQAALTRAVIPPRRDKWQVASDKWQASKPFTGHWSLATGHSIQTGFEGFLLTAVQQ